MLKNFRLLIPLCLFLAALPPLQAESGRAQMAFDEAVRLRQEGQFIEAERMFTEALQLDPANAGYHFELANLYASRHDRLRDLSAHEESKRMLQLAAAQLEQTVMLKPDFLAAQYNLGVVYKNLGRYENAREQFQKVLQLDPPSVSAQMQIGAVYEEQGFFDEAEDAYLAAKEKDFYNPDIQTALDDLEEHRHEDHQRMLAQSEPRGYSRLQQGFNYSDYSLAQGLETDRRAAQAGQQGLQQALPYLGAMLVEQFMKKRGTTEEE